MGLAFKLFRWGPTNAWLMLMSPHFSGLSTILSTNILSGFPFWLEGPGIFLGRVWVLGICSFWYIEVILCPALGSWPTCWSVLISPPSLVSTHLAPSHPLLYSATFTVGLVQFLKEAWVFACSFYSFHLECASSARLHWGQLELGSELPKRLFLCKYASLISSPTLFLTFKSFCDLK